MYYYSNKKNKKLLLALNFKFKIKNVNDPLFFAILKKINVIQENYLHHND